VPGNVGKTLPGQKEDRVMISSRDILQGIDIMAPRTCHTVDDDPEGLIPNLAYIINEAAQRIYIASPIATYQSPRYDQKLAQIARHFPGAEILQARHLFDSTADWRRRWPKARPTCRSCRRASSAP